MEDLKTKELKQWKIVYEGQAISLNDFYSQGHFSTRYKISEKYGKIFRNLIESEGVPKLLTYSISCRYNSRHDPSNVSGMVKMMEDALAGGKNRMKKTYKYEPLIKDDSKKYCKRIEIVPDESLRNNTFVFTIEGEEE